MKLNKKILFDSIVGLVLGIFLVYIPYLMLSKDVLLKFLPDESFSQNFNFFASLLIAPFTALMLHELGHLLAGIFQGFKLELFVVGFFGIKRNNDSVKVFFNTEIQYFGGVAATSPTNNLTDQELIRKYKTILLSGPIVSLIFGIVTFWVLYFTSSIFNTFFALLSVTSFGIFLATTIPNKSGIFFTDRKRYQRLSNKGETGTNELAFLQIVNQSLLEKNCKNLPLESVQKLTTDEDKIVQFWGYYFEYQYYKDNEYTGIAESKKQNLLEYKQIMPSAIWKNLQID